MSLYTCPKFKIRIDPSSKKTQGLRQGDIVRRQYFDYPNNIYSLMIVVETGTDIITGQDNEEKRSPYFIGMLVDGNEPKNGEILDFVRVTNLFDADRSGALYLTASDSESPFMDVIDGMATETRFVILLPETEMGTCPVCINTPVLEKNLSHKNTARQRKVMCIGYFALPETTRIILHQRRSASSKRLKGRLVIRSVS